MVQVETPESEGNPEDQNKTWMFREHNFTLTVFWSQFLVASTAIGGTNGFNIHLNIVDNWWSDQLPSIDYTVISASHWFFRPNYFYHNGHVIGCMACNHPGIINFEPGLAIRMAFRTALWAINDCPSCKKKIVTLVRTYTPGLSITGRGTTEARVTVPCPWRGTRWIWPNPIGGIARCRRRKP